MVSGKVNGGPYDGKVIESDIDFLYLPQEIEEEKTIANTLGMDKDKKLNQIVYEKCWHRIDNVRWYEWRQRF